jgi:hypothetical protein
MTAIPYAWADPNTNSVFTSRIHADNYSTQNHRVELIPLYKERPEDAKMLFLDHFQKLIDDGATLKKQENGYCIYDKTGLITTGLSIRELMVNLIFAVC